MLRQLKSKLRQITPLRRSWQVLKRVYGRFAHPTSEARVGGMVAEFHTAHPGHRRRVEKMMGEREELETFLGELGEGDVLWDVGAHMGIYSVFSAKRLAESDGRVVAFEPEPEIRSLLEQNCLANGLEDVVEFQAVALGDASGEVTLRRPENSGGATLDNSRSLGYEQEPEVVELVRGDTLVERGVPRPDVIKMDIEGAEYLALKGMPEILEGCRVVFVEVHTDSEADGRPMADALADLLAEHGFELDEIGSRGSQRHWLCRKP